VYTCVSSTEEVDTTEDDEDGMSTDMDESSEENSSDGEHVCMYVCIRGGPFRPLHRDPQWSIVLPLSLIILQQSRTSDVAQDFIRGDV
jgi:hypothetical protein